MLIPRTKFSIPITADPAPSRVNVERMYPRILSSIMPIKEVKEAYGKRAGSKPAGSLRTGISWGVIGVEGGGGRRRRETTGFCTTELWLGYNGAHNNAEKVD